MPCAFYTLLYCLSSYFISKCSNKISIFPRFSTQELSFDLLISQKDLFCANTFESFHYFSHRIFGWDTGKYIDMIICYSHFHCFTVFCFQYLFKKLLFGISKLFFKCPLAIFGCPQKIMSYVVNCMANSFDGHATYYTKCLYKVKHFFPVLPHGVSRIGFL